LEEEIARPGLEVTLQWSGPYTWSDVRQRPILGNESGFYIAFTRDLGNTQGIPGVLVRKVGKTERSFRARFGEKDYRSWSFFIAPYPTPAMKLAVTRASAIEHAIARTLMRAGEGMPAHQMPRSVLLASAPIKLTNPLPPDWQSKLSAAYTHPSSAANTGQPAVPPRAFEPNRASSNQLSLRTGERWELEDRNL
jgi:hypothetical protein